MEETCDQYEWMWIMVGQLVHGDLPEIQGPIAYAMML